MRQFEDGREFALKKDREDNLAKFGERFYKLPGTIYMDGNSLGLLSRDAEESLAKALDAWKNGGIDIWMKYDYFLYHEKLGAMMAELIGAEPEEVTCLASTTVNLHQAIATLYHPTKERYKILADDLNFPTDRYAIDSQLALHGYSPDEAVKIVKSRDGEYICEDDIIAAMTDDVAMVILPSALYRSAQLVDIERITREAHKRGILAGFDLCHSIGAVPYRFREFEPDFAVWCTYKYLNGGPGAVAGLYLNKRHFAKESGLAGWWGNRSDTQFELKHRFEHDSASASGLQIGTSAILSMAPLEGSLKMIREAGIGNLREKSLDITAYLMYLIDTKLAKYGFTVGNRREDAARTGHVALVHEDAIRINAAFKDNGILPDFRFPNVIRLAPVPLYTTYAEVYDMVEIIVKIMDGRLYEKYESKINTVA